MGLATSYKRFIMLQLTGQRVAPAKEILPKVSDYELVSSNNKSNETAKEEIDIKSEDVPSNILMSNLGINIIKTTPTETQIKQIKDEKESTLASLKANNYEIASNMITAEKNPTTRSQEDIQKDLDKIKAQIEKEPKKYETKYVLDNVRKSEITTQGKKVTEIKIYLKDGSTKTFKSQKEYDKYEKKYGTKTKVQIETPKLKKLKGQKCALETELNSAKARDYLPKLQEKSAQLENKIAGYDEKLKELGVKEESTKDYNNISVDNMYSRIKSDPFFAENEHQRDLINLEISSVQKVIDDNIDNDFKKFA